MELVIRPARMNDLKEIWNLLHANQISWTDARIIAELPKLRVMQRDSKILGVLNGYFEAKVLKIEWVAIHPLYPEKQLREAMIEGFCAIFGLDRGEKKKVLSNYELALELE